MNRAAKTKIPERSSVGKTPKMNDTGLFLPLLSHGVQIDVVLATRDDLMKQRAELETRAKQQSQDQSDIYQYLRNKLKDNYVAIAELETKVSRGGGECPQPRVLAIFSLFSSLSDCMHRKTLAKPEFLRDDGSHARKVPRNKRTDNNQKTHGLRICTTVRSLGR